MIIAADENITFWEETFSRQGTTKAYSAKELSPDNLKEAEALLVRSVTKVNRDLLEGTAVKFVGTATTGTDNIDEKYLKKRGIALASAPGSNSNAVAEYIVAVLLSLAPRKNFSLRGKTIGIIGVGNVGSKVVQKCQALGMKTLLNDPPLVRKTKDKKYLPLKALFVSDVITLHVPLTYYGRDATFHMVDEKFLSQMKNGAILINSSRGNVVDESALLKTLKKKKLDSVVLDVWENEPNINIELLQHVDIATPHIAGYSLEGKVQATTMLYQALGHFFNKEDNWSPISLLPPPEKGVIKIDCSSNCEEEIIAQVVKETYNPEADNSRLRKILSLPQNERGKFFSGLRKNYPSRREFYNFKLQLKNCPVTLDQKLAGLGFLLK